jgi:DNA-directed RNA polymerase subunit omega
VIYPSIDRLLNIVDSKYKLVHIAAMRSKQMLINNHYQMKESDYISKKTIGRSLEELEKGLIKIKNANN